MKYLFFLMLGASFLVGAQPTEPTMDDEIRDYQERQAIDESSPRQEQETRRVPGSPEDPLGEFEEPFYDTGNGTTTNQNMDWPEP